MKSDIINNAIGIGKRGDLFFNAVQALDTTPQTGVVESSDLGYTYVIPDDMAGYVEKPVMIEAVEPVNTQTIVVDDTVPGSFNPVKPTANVVDIAESSVVIISDSGVNTTILDPLTGDQAGFVGMGGGGSLDFSNETSENKVASDGGFVQVPKGIEVTGYIYPYPFILLTLGCGAFGYYMGHKFKQPMLSKLALTAAGLMAGSAIGMKVKPPVRKPS